MMQRAVIYCRVNNVKNPGQAISSQLTICRDYCRRWKLEVIAEYCDEGYSGRKVDRPGYASLMALALDDNRPFDSIVVMDKARFLEDPKFYETYEALLGGFGVMIRPVEWERVHIPTEVDWDLPLSRQAADFVAEGEEIIDPWAGAIDMTLRPREPVYHGPD